MLRLEKTVLSPTDELNAVLTAAGTTPVSTGVRLLDLLKRPQLDYDKLESVDKNRPPLEKLTREQVETELKYEGYIRRELASIHEMRRLEKRLLPADIDYTAIHGLRLEAQEKLSAIRPLSVGQASRISGVSPSDVSVLILWLSQKEDGR